MMTEERQLMMWAATSFAVTYLILLFIAGAWVEPRPIVWKLALFSLGTGYICTWIKSIESRSQESFRIGVARVTFWASIAAGSAAGVGLL